MTAIPAYITPHHLAVMRSWIADCGWKNLEPEQVDDLTDDEVVGGVRNHHVGGLDGFLSLYDHDFGES